VGNSGIQPKWELGYAWMTCDTLRAAFERLVRFRKILNEDVHLELRESSDTLSFVVRRSSEENSPAFRVDGAMALLHDKLLLEYIAKLDKDNIIERTKVSIIDNMPSGNISDAIIARSLQMSERTLQRRLREFGTTFKSILNEVRQDLANSYIRDSKLSLTEISFMLGFAEISTFSRAYKRWTGQSPSAFRQIN
jgi:AraC-like DNA-binding protein